MATSSADETVKIWNPNNNWNQIRTFTGHSNWIEGLDWINEDTIVSGSLDTTIQIWSIKTGLVQRKINVGIYVSCVKVLSNGFDLASCLSNGNINVYNINNGSLVACLRGHESWAENLVLINNSSLASSSFDTTIIIWDLATSKVKFILKGHSSSVWALELISSDILASASYGTKIKLWNATNGIEIRTLSNHTGGILNSLGVLNNLDDDHMEKVIFSGSTDQTIKMWNWTTGECLKTINAGFYIYSLASIRK